MPYFKYQGETPDGKPVDGVIEAEDVSVAIQQLHQSGVSVLGIRTVEPNQAQLQREEDCYKKKMQSVIDSLRPATRQIEQLAEDLPSKTYRRHARYLCKKLRGIDSIEQLLANDSTRELLPILLRENDQRETNSSVIRWLQDSVEQQQRRNRRRRVWIYPAVVSVLCLAILIFLSIFVTPIFQQMTAEFGLEVPPITQFIFWVGEQVTVYGLRNLILLTATLAVLVSAIRWWRRRAMTNRILGSWVSGTTSSLEAMARLAESLAELIRWNVPTAYAMRLAASASGHYYLQQAMEDMVARLPLDERLQARGSLSRRLPPLLLFALQSVEGSDSQVALLRCLARIYRQRSAHRMESSSLLFPVMVVLTVGTLVAITVIALFAPQVSLISSLA